MNVTLISVAEHAGYVGGDKTSIKPEIRKELEERCKSSSMLACFKWCRAFHHKKVWWNQSRGDNSPYVEALRHGRVKGRC